MIGGRWSGGHRLGAIAALGTSVVVTASASVVGSAAASRPLSRAATTITAEQVVFKGGRAVGLEPYSATHRTGLEVRFITPPRGFDPRTQGLAYLHALGLKTPMKTPAERAFWARTIDHWKSTVVPTLSVRSGSRDVSSRPSGAKGISRLYGTPTPPGGGGTNPPQNLWDGWMDDACPGNSPGQLCTFTTQYNTISADFNVPTVYANTNNDCADPARSGEGLFIWTGLGGDNDITYADGTMGAALIQDGLTYSDSENAWNPFFEVLGEKEYDPITFNTYNDANGSSEHWKIEAGDDVNSFTEYLYNSSQDAYEAWFWMEDLTTGQFEIIQLIGSSGTGGGEYYTGNIASYYDGSTAEAMVESYQPYESTNINFSDVWVSGEFGEQSLYNEPAAVPVDEGVTGGYAWYLSYLTPTDSSDPSEGGSFTVTGASSTECNS